MSTANRYTHYLGAFVLTFGLIGAGAALAEDEATVIVIDEDTRVESLALPEAAADTARERAAFGQDTANEARERGSDFGRETAAQARERAQSGREAGAAARDDAAERAGDARERGRGAGRN